MFGAATPWVTTRTLSPFANVASFAASLTAWSRGAVAVDDDVMLPPNPNS